MQLVVCSIAIVLGLVASDWNPESFADESTLEFRTVGPEEGEYWSPVWFAVIDDALYVRLGSRAAGRVERNTTAPRFDVRVGGQEYPMRYGEAPEMAERVNTEFRAKYWTSIFGEPFRRLGLTSPVILRLVPATTGSAEP